MKISEIKEWMENLEVEGVIVYAGKAKRFKNKFGREVTVRDFELSDGSGSITLTLFGKRAFSVRKGQRIR